MKLNPIIKQLLNKRGIESDVDMEEFLSDKPKKTYDPFLLPDMEAGVDLILSETSKGSKICIYGDYDADGITSTALMMSVLGHLTPKENIDYYIPSRFDEGYGLNKEAIDTIAARGCNFIITVDCGSVSYNEVEYAKERGMKIMVTDHHNTAEIVPDCIVINPKHPKSQYPFRDLSGCGVAFKLAQALQKRANLPKQALSEVLDLVAIGTIGDIMPLIDENRTMAKFGIKVINLGHREGLKRLIEGAALKMGNINSGNISFVIVPHLNASGRIEDASQAVELLLGRCSDVELEKIVEDILAKNVKRRNLQTELFNLCDINIDEENLEDLILMEADSKHEGIAGIVAGKLKEAYYRPAIILTPTGEDGSVLKGTGRSIEGLNLYELLKTQEHLFQKFGGHQNACGFSMDATNLDSLKQGLKEQMKLIVEQNTDIFNKKYHIDLELKTEELTMELAEQLDLLEPFGNQNPRPLILCKDVKIADPKYMGNEMQHVRFYAKGQTAAKIQCILFNKAQNYDLYEMAINEVDIIGKLESQVWQGTKRLQFLTEEIQIDGKVSE